MEEKASKPTSNLAISKGVYDRFADYCGKRNLIMRATADDILSWFLSEVRQIQQGIIGSERDDEQEEEFCIALADYAAEMWPGYREHTVKFRTKQNPGTTVPSRMNQAEASENVTLRQSRQRDKTKAPPHQGSKNVEGDSDLG